MIICLLFLFYTAPLEAKPFPVTLTPSYAVEDFCKLTPTEKRKVYWRLLLVWKLVPDLAPSKQKAVEVATGEAGDQAEGVDNPPPADKMAPKKG